MAISGDDRVALMETGSDSLDSIVLDLRHITLSSSLNPRGLICGIDVIPPKLPMSTDRLDTIFDIFVNTIIVANKIGATAAGSLTQTLENRIVAWQEELFEVASVEHAVLFVLAEEDGGVDEVLVKLNVASPYHYLRWLPLARKWGLVTWNEGSRKPDFSVISYDPEEIARETIGGMLSMYHRVSAGQPMPATLAEPEPVRRGYCFLCNESEATTEEHVFPKWLQHDFDLWNLTLGLLNQTGIRYRSLKVPACAECNNTRLKAIEDTISEAVRGGYHEAKSLDPTTVFYWVGKIFLGVLVKQTQLLVDRKDPRRKDTIVPASLNKGINTLRKWLRSIYSEIEFEHPKPWVAFVLHTQASSIRFQYSDSVPELTFMIQMGDVAFIVVAMDHLARSESAGPPSEMFDRLTNTTYGRLIRDQIGEQAIHPIQLIELHCRITHQHSLATISPAFRELHINDQPNLPRVGSIPVPYEMEEWSEDAILECVRFRSRPLGIRVEGTGSFLFDDESNFVATSDEDLVRQRDD